MGATGTDVIRLVGLGGAGRHGVLPEERRNGQLFKVDLLMRVDTRAAATSDDLAQTVNYAEVASDVVALIEGEPVNLVETLAARIADTVLAHPAVQSVEVTVHKPEAPVGVPFDDVQVIIVRDREPASVAPAVPVPVHAAVEPAPEEGLPPLEAAAPVSAPAPEPPSKPADLDAQPDEPVEVVLGLGGNLGDVRATLRRAIDDLAASGVLEIIDVAPLAKTAAVLQPDAVSQPDYLNTVVVARTSASPRAVLAATQQVEAAHGRVREQRWGERTLDVDILTYGSVSSADPELTLPHPRANERAFVLVPWAHLDPDAFLPGLGGGPVALLADTAPDRDGVRWLALDWYERGSSAGPAPAAVAAAAPVAEDVAQQGEPEDVSTSRVDTGGRAAAFPQPDLSAYQRPAETAPEPVADPVPVPELVPTQQPEAPPEPEPAPQPEPTLVPAPQPEPTLVPAPEPEPASEPEPTLVPEPTRVPASEPESTLVPEPEHTMAPEQPLVPAPVSQPAPASIEEPEPGAEPRSPSPAPWEQDEQDPSSATRIRPRWAPIRGEDSEG